MIFRPILRWKRGEQSALSQLSDSQKNSVIPLITIPGHSYDPPLDESVDSNFDNRIIKDAERLTSAWDGYTVSVDLNAIDPDARCENNEHPVTLFFQTLSTETDAHPVLTPDSDDEFIDAVADLQIDPVFRLTPDDLASPEIGNIITSQLRACQTSADRCDVIIDLGYVSTIGRSVLTARGALSSLPFFNDWQSITLASGSFPANLSQFSVGDHLVERIEVAIWTAVTQSLTRSIEYGDYATIHPIPVEESLDPRTMNPSASVRYTHDDDWLLLRGEGTRNRGGRGFSQFQDHAVALVQRPEYRGPDFSYGDFKISQIAQGIDGNGNLETWVTIGINHHIAEILDQFSNFP